MKKVPSDMSPVDRGELYSIDGLITLHDLHPELREILVEGRTDQGIISWFTRNSGIEVDVFPVSERVDVPAELVKKHGQNVGNRGRVIAAATEFEVAPESVKSQLMCIADSDFDHITGKEYDQECLARTDLAALELHAVNEVSLARFRDLYLHGDPQTDLFRTTLSLLPAVAEIFAVRYILESSEYPPGLIEKIETCIEWKDGAWTVNTRTLIQKSCSGQGYSKTDIDTFHQAVVEIQKSLPVNLLIRVNWHDFVRVFIKALGLRNDLAKPEVVERGLVACLEIKIIESERLFRSIKEKFGNQK